MPIRNFNPFKKAPTAQDLYEQNNGIRSSTEKGFQDASVKAANPIEIKEPTEYKLSGMRLWSECHSILGAFAILVVLRLTAHRYQ